MMHFTGAVQAQPVSTRAKEKAPGMKTEGAQKKLNTQILAASVTLMQAAVTGAALGATFYLVFASGVPHV